MQTTENKIMITAQDVKPGDSYIALFGQPRTVVKVITKADKTMILFSDDCNRSHGKSDIVTVIRKVPQVAVQDNEAVELASQVVNYCHSKALSLGGLVERIKAAGYVTRETADAVIVYCEEHSLMLGGLVSTLASFSNEMADVASVATEIKGVAAEYIDERYDELTEVQRACLIEIVNSLSITDSRVVELFKASGLNY